VNAAEDVAQVGGQGAGADDGVGASLDLYGPVTAGGADELPDRPAGAVLDPGADGEGGEHDRQVGLDRVALAVVNRPGLQVAFWYPERFLDLVRK